VPPCLVRALAVATLGGVLTASAAGVAGAQTSAPPHRAVATTTGTLPDGATWIIEVPAGWNGTVLLYQHGLVPPGAPNPAVDASDPLSGQFLLDQGYALAGSAFATGFAVDDALRDQLDLLDVFATSVGRPRRTITWGDSLGGLVAAQLAERAPDRIDGAVSLCGVLSGGVGLWNSYLDMLFTAKTLLAPASTVELTRITDPFASAQEMVGILEAAQATPDGRARIALAAAMGNLPGWTDADEPEPDPADATVQQANQFDVMSNVTVLLGILERAEVEGRAGGNPSSNTGVDYDAILRRSADRREVKALYEQAGLDLAADLRRLAGAPRISADPGAVAYLEETASPNGHLGHVPVLTVHTVADPLAPVENEQAYAAQVARAGDTPRLRQVFTHRAGHCAFSPAEKVAALQTLIGRVEIGRWSSTAPTAMNGRARALGPDLNADLDDETGQLLPTTPAFTAFTPGPFPRAVPR
jgi:pimeloyl-ACP methyl ester carboxylesterase